jgi:hypothetical protein
MRVSVSVPSEAARPRLGAAVAAAIALASLLAHLPSLAPSLEDIDSINFALGLHHFDVASHQPHPPGYPVYIALGRMSLAAIAAVASSLSAIRTDALALAIWSAIGTAVALLAAASVFASLEETEPASVASSVPRPVSVSLAVALTAAAPLFWMSGLRPMSDMPGLAVALVAMALVLRGRHDRRALIAGSMVAGIAIGIRSQTVWLTVPLILLVLIEQRRAGLWWLLSRPVAAGAIACLAWALPLLAVSGGFTGYVRALGSQAGEDFAWVDMLWANPTPRRLAFTLYETFVLPWHSLPLAVAVLIPAAAGGLMLLARNRRALLILSVGFGPYLAFHMLFQETLTVRYGLPVIPAIAYLAVRGAIGVGRAGTVFIAAVVAFALVVAVPAGIAYGAEPHPAFRAIAAMTGAAAAQAPGGVYAHFALRRPLQVAAAASLHLQEPRPAYEWLGPVDYWRRGGRAVLWFLADPKRTDLALFDRLALTDVQHYRWAVGGRGELSGTRPNGVDWYRIPPPRWFAGEGWALTPETGGIAQASGKGIDRQPIEAFVRRGPQPLRVLVGTRFLDGTGDAVHFELSIDGVSIDAWNSDVTSGRNLLHLIDLPDGIPGAADGYARLVIAARPVQAGRSMPRVAVRQFDVQPAGGLLFGFGEGWHEEEYDNTTGVRWRWTSDRSLLEVVPPQGIRLTLRGESPLKYFDAAPIVTVSAGGEVVGTLRPAADFEWTVDVPAAAVIRGGGTVAIATDRVYLPGQVEGTADRRRLGLRLYELHVNPVDR